MDRQIPNDWWKTRMKYVSGKFDWYIDVPSLLAAIENANACNAPDMQAYLHRKCRNYIRRMRARARRENVNICSALQPI